MSCVTVTEYNPQNGFLMGIWTVEEEMLPEIGVHYYIEGGYDKNEFFVDVEAAQPTIKERPPMKIRQNKTEIKADGAELVKFSKLPKPCKVQVNGEDYQVKDGIFEWGTRLPGVYVVRVVAFPFLDWEGTVTAV